MYFIVNAEFSSKMLTPCNQAKLAAVELRYLAHLLGAINALAYFLCQCVRVYVCVCVWVCGCVCARIRAYMDLGLCKNAGLYISVYMRRSERLTKREGGGRERGWLGRGGGR